MLGDSSRFAIHHVGFTNLIKKLCFPVIYVTHDGNNRRAQRCFVIGGVVDDVKQFKQLDFLFFAEVNHADFRTNFSGKEFDHVIRKRLGSGNHFALLHQETHHVCGGTV